MPTYAYNPVTPEGWAVDENGKFVQVPEGFIRSGDEFVKGPETMTPMTPEAPMDKNAGGSEWVGELYKRYFDRSPTKQELDVWGRSTPQELEQFLLGEQEKYGYVSNEQRSAQDANLKTALDMIDMDPSIPIAMKQYAKDIVTAYEGDATANFDDIMATFNKLKEETIDPYYASQVGFLQKGFQASYEDLQASRELEREYEQANATQAIEDAQANLEARGLTSSGEAVKALGMSSALPGITAEGAVPRANRLIASSSGLRYRESLRNLGRQQEAALGSGAVLPGYAPSGGIMGSVEESRQQALGGALGGVADSLEARNALTKTKKLDFGY